MKSQEKESENVSGLNQALKALLKVLEYPINPNPVTQDTNLGY